MAQRRRGARRGCTPCPQACRHQGEDRPGGLRPGSDPSPVRAKGVPWAVALTEGQQPHPPRSHHDAGGVLHLPSDPQPFFPEGTARGERAELGMAAGKKGTGVHGGQGDRPKCSWRRAPSKGCGGLPKAGDGPTIFALVEVGSPKPLVRLPCRMTSSLAVASRRTRRAAVMAWS